MIEIIDGVYMGVAEPASGGGTTINNQDKTITINGQYTADTGYTGLGTVTVNVPDGQKYGATASSFLGDVNSSGVLQPPSANTNLVFSGVEDIASGALRNICYLKPNIISVSFPDLVNITGLDALNGSFYGNTNLTTISFPKLKIVNAIRAMNNTFYGNTGISSTSFPALEEITSGCNSTFYNNSNITTVSLPELKTIGTSGAKSMFFGCAKISSLDVSKLESIGSEGLSNAFAINSGDQNYLTSITFDKLNKFNGTYALQNCFRFRTALQSLSFPALKSTSFGTINNCFNDMLQGITGCTVHFPSNLQSVIGNWYDVTNGFGGTNTTVLFDLPATE